MPRQVDYYFSFQSPWAYIGHKPFSDLVNSYDLKVNHKPVVLVDLFSETGGLPLMKRRSRLASIPIDICVGPLPPCGKTSSIWPIPP